MVKESMSNKSSYNTDDEPLKLQKTGRPKIVFASEQAKHEQQKLLQHRRRALEAAPPWSAPATFPIGSSQAAASPALEAGQKQAVQRGSQTGPRPRGRAHEIEGYQAQMEDQAVCGLQRGCSAYCPCCCRIASHACEAAPNREGKY